MGNQTFFSKSQILEKVVKPNLHSHGNYGTKVKKAMELNCKGCNISILKEEEFIKSLK